MKGTALVLLTLLVPCFAAQTAVAAPPKPTASTHQEDAPAQPAVTQALPDLKVNRVFLAKWTPPQALSIYQEIPSTVKAGEKVLLACEFTNIGTLGVTGDYDVLFFVGPNLIGYQTIHGGPNPGQLRKTAVAWTAAGVGDHVCRCWLDPADKIHELDSANETNNTGALVVHVTPAMAPPSGAVAPKK